MAETTFQNTCMICANTGSYIGPPRPGEGGEDFFWFNCNRCGRYGAVRSLVTAGVQGVNRRLHDESGTRLYTASQFSAVLRDINERGADIPILGTDFSSILERANIPKSLDGKINHLIDVIAGRATTMGRPIKFNHPVDYPLAFVEDGKEFAFILDVLVKEYKYLLAGRLEGDFTLYYITAKGWRHIESVKNGVQSRGSQAFVAMWFDAIVTPAFTEGIQPALEEVGYIPRRIDMVEHNEKIDDEIIAQIRQSGILVADMTGKRGGVYYEAGFAKGLNIPVIWTIQDRLIETGQGKQPEVETVHFDTRQYNFIVWKDAADLKEKLINRLRATNLALR